MKNFLNYIKQIFLALIILLGVFIIGFFSSVVLGGIFRSFMSTEILEITAMLGVRSPYFWLILLFLLAVIMFFPVLFSVFVYKDCEKISLKYGIKTNSYFWAIGVLFPTAIFIFPSYLIKRNIIWTRRINN